MRHNFVKFSVKCRYLPATEMQVNYDQRVFVYSFLCKHNDDKKEYSDKVLNVDSAEKEKLRAYKVHTNDEKAWD